MPKDKASIANEHFTFDLGDRKVALLKSAMLVNEPVVSCDQDIGRVGRGQLSHHDYDILQGILDRVSQTIFRSELVSDRVDLIMVDIDHVMVAENLFQLVALEVLEILGPERDHAVARATRGKHFFPVLNAARGLFAVKYECALILQDLQGGMGQKSRHPELGITWQNANHGLQLGVKPIQRANARQALLGDLIPHRVRDDDTDFLIAAAEVGRMVPIEIDLPVDTGDLPSGDTIDLLLPRIIQLQQKIVAVEVFNSLKQAAQEAGLGALLIVIDEAAVLLVEPKPRGRVSVETLGEARHAEIHFGQALHELGGEADCVINVLERAIPMAVGPVAHPPQHFTWRRGLLGQPQNDLADDLAVHRFKDVHLDQVTEIAFGDVGLDVQRPLEPLRKGLKVTRAGLVVFPAPEKNQRLSVQCRSLGQAHGVTCLEQSERKVLDVRCACAIAIGVPDLLPYEVGQPKTINQTKPLLPLLRKIGQQRLNDRIKPARGPGADGQHAQAHLALRVGGLPDLLQRLDPALGFEELGMVLHHRGKSQF